MNRGQKDEETRRSIQLIILLCYIIYSIGLAVTSIIRDWEIWTVPILAVGSFICFSLYITHQFDFRYQIYIYAGFVSLATFFYGTHKDMLVNFSLVVVLAMIIFSLTEEKGALRIFFMTYIMLILYHAVLVILGKEDLEGFIPSSELFNFIAVVVANRIGNYICEVLSISRGVADDLEEELDDMKERSEDFMANVSHELRTPINVVMGLTSILLKDERDKQRKANLSAIQGAGRRLFGRIEDILDYTEIDTGSVVLADDEYRISSIINDVATEYRETTGGDKAELVVDMDVNIPARMVGDASRIKRIIRHLVTNAMKFTDSNGCVYLHVFARKKEYGVNLCIDVIDTGIGMSADALKRVTKAAYQADSGRSRRAEGIGLGLGIVYGFVKKMGGFIHIESVEKKGTKVSVSIPQQVTDEKASVVAENAEKMIAVCYFNAAKYKSLAIREYYKTMLRSAIGGLGISAHLVNTMDELKQSIASDDVTHIVTAEEEYLENKDYYDNIGRETCVIVAVNQDFAIKGKNTVTFVRKPVFSHSLVNAINSKTALWEFDSESSGKKLTFDNVKTLVVDDEEMNLIVAKGILSDYGMDVTLVRSGMEAVHECEKTSFDVILMDHMMPEMDGVEAMKLIKRNYGSDDHTAIVAFTANAVSGVREMFVKEGFDEFLSKPIETSELERILKKVLPSSMWQYKDVEESIEQTEGIELNEERQKYGFTSIKESDGIRNCRGNEAFYEELLEEFTKETPEILDELQQYFNEKNWVNYRVKLNGLKCAATLIGADDLYKEAHEIERAAAESWEAYIIANHEAIERQIDAVNSDIRKIHGGDAS